VVEFDPRSVLPGPTKPSLPLHPKMTAILAPFTATRAILQVQPHISAQMCSYNWKILPKVLIIRSCMLIFIKRTLQNTVPVF
jgi:hypothetical protein